MRLTVLALLTFLPALSGCAALLTEAVVNTPRQLNPLRSFSLPLPDKAFGLRERITVPITTGGEALEISVAVMDPVDPTEEPRGTILVLHGIRADGYWMLDFAESFADAGFRVLLADLRGHGASTGETLTFGLHEARDLVSVIDELKQRGLLAGDLGVFGHSYGATTAIHLAAIDPRIKTVIATAPFADMRDEVPHYVRTMLPGVGHLLSDEFYEEVIARAAQRAEFDPEAAAAEVAMQRVACPVLLLHGADDLVVPPENSQRLYAHAPAGSKLIYLRDIGHLGVWLDRDGRVKKHTLQWLDEQIPNEQPSRVAP